MKTLKNIMMIALAAIVSISLFSCSPDPVTEKKESIWVMHPSLAGQKYELWTEPAYEGDTGAKLGYLEFAEDNPGMRIKLVTIDDIHRWSEGCTSGSEGE